MAILLALSAMSPAQAEEDVRPYDDELFRLSEILGSIHYLRELCGAKEGQLWREEMQGLLKTEGTSASRRIKLVRSFNKGYRNYRRTYRSCTRSAKTAVDRFLVEGTELAETMLRVDE
ncbi:MAG: TIGR02301 family protein [Hyphomicrobiaceae bacterium]